MNEFVCIYRDAVPGAVRSVRPGKSDVLGGPAPGEEGAGQPDVGAHQGVALPAGVNHYGLGVLWHCNTRPDRRVGLEINTQTPSISAQDCAGGREAACYHLPFVDAVANASNFVAFKR